MIIPVVGPTYALESRSFDAQRCVNLIPEASESGTSKGPARLVGRFGLKSYVTAGSGPIRGAITTAGGRAFAVSGTTLYEITAGPTATSRGTLNTVNGRVSISENGTQMLIVDGTNGYIFTLATNTLAEITDADFPDAATICAFQDTYFLVNNPGTGDFYISANNDGTSWASTDKTTVESAPDNLVSLLSDHGELFLFGDKTVEVYYNSGRESFPFQRIGQAIMQVGCAAAHTACSFDRSVVWLGSDDKGRRFVWTVGDAYRPERISNLALEQTLDGAADISQAYAYTFGMPGHEFYVLQVPTLASTWIFDASTKLWHEWSWYNEATELEEIFLGSCFFTFDGKRLAGSRVSGKVYEIDTETFSDDGQEIHRMRRTLHVSDEMRETTIAALHLDMETGVGKDGGGRPSVMLRVSKDGGRVYGPERVKSFGAVGEYKPRPRWTRLGTALEWVFEFRITDKARVSINNCYAEVA